MAQLIINPIEDTQHFLLMTEDENVIAVIKAKQGEDILDKVLTAAKESWFKDEVLFRYFGNAAETTIHIKTIDDGEAFDRVVYLLKTIMY